MSVSPAYFGRDLEAMSSAVNYLGWIADQFRPFLGETTAEVGAGSGNFSAVLLEKGVRRIAAYEPSSNMFPLLKTRFEGESRVTAIQGYFGENSSHFTEGFDSVCYVNVLEHVEDDRRELKRVWEALKEGGYLLIFVPALPWLYGKLDKKLGHYRRYRKAGLHRIVEEAGFEVHANRYFDFLGVLPWFISVVLMGKGLAPASVAFYDRWAVPLCRTLEALFPPPLGKNLLLVARKKNR